jgi:hypothetical protein
LMVGPELEFEKMFPGIAAKVFRATNSGGARDRQVAQSQQR